MKVYKKTASAPAIAFELAGLADLQAAQKAGGAWCAPVIEKSTTYLTTAFITRRPPTRSAARAFGRALAYTHAYLPTPGTNRLFGQAPSSFSAKSGFMGSISLPLISAAGPRRSFGEFYGADRLLPYLPAALANGSIDIRGGKLIEKLAEKLRDGAFDSPQPQLVKSDAALLHGDLWSGNLLWGIPPTLPAPLPSAKDAPASTPTAKSSTSPTLHTATESVAGILIDPASHGGHSESDLAQLGVFGADFIPDIYAGYEEVSPLASGWKERIGLHQLHMLIVHAVIFGGGYGAAVIDIAQKYI